MNSDPAPTSSRAYDAFLLLAGVVLILGSVATSFW
jgi:hypothetical protein